MGVSIGITEILLILVIIVGIAVYKKETPAEKIVVIGNASSAGSASVNTRTGDDRYKMAPRPQRMWEAEPEIPIRGALDPIATRGAPESYQQMGVMVGSDGKPLPLYGRRVAPRSDRFNYYTRTDSYNPVALPVTFNKKDCQDNLGCDEVSNGDSVRISPTGETAKVTLYGFDGPRYSPDA
jgi:hypothetical protein